MIGVVIPAKNEEGRLGACLASLARAAVHPGLEGEPVLVTVVLDDCTDGSLAVARAAGVATVVVHYSNVGAARARGARFVFDAGARWLACTDADSVVAADWLVAQLAEGADLVCGTVAVEDWSEHPSAVVERFRTEYRDHADHRHIHGANLGVSRAAYERVNGFAPLAAHEDVALVRALESTGLRIAWSARPRVVTSARIRGRAPQGFAASLRKQNEELALTGTLEPTT